MNPFKYCLHRFARAAIQLCNIISSRTEFSYCPNSKLELTIQHYIAYIIIIICRSICHRLCTMQCPRDPVICTGKNINMYKSKTVWSIFICIHSLLLCVPAGCPVWVGSSAMDEACTVRGFASAVRWSAHRRPDRRGLVVGVAPVRTIKKLVETRDIKPAVPLRPAAETEAAAA